MLQKYLLAVAVVIIIAERGNILVCTPDMLLLYLALPHSSHSIQVSLSATPTLDVQGPQSKRLISGTAVLGLILVLPSLMVVHAPNA